MKLLDIVALRFRSLFQERAVENDVEQELQFHLDATAELLRAHGMTEFEARWQARRDFGNMALHREQIRDQRGWNWLKSLQQDARYSARALMRAPGFTAVSIFSLALGIGATSAIFSIFDVAVLHPLSARNTDRLVWFREFGKNRTESGGNPARLLDWQRARSFETVAGFYGEGAILSADNSRVRLDGVRYLGKFPQVLGALPQIGRLPAPDEVSEGAPVLVLTDSAWRRQFHAEAEILSRTLRLSGKLYRVVGVLDAQTRYPESTDFWAPAPREVQATAREAGFLAQIARLPSGVALAQAQAEVDTLAAQLGAEHPATDRGRTLRLQPLSDHLSEGSRKALLLFLAAAAGVLLIACVNVAGLLLARGLNRQREVSVRAALGATGGRLVRLFLTESLLLALAGCLAGMLMAVLSLDALKSALPQETPRLADAAITLRVVLFAASLTVASALLCGLLPAWKAASRSTSAGLKEGSHGSVGGLNTRLRSVLVTAQIAASLLLLVAGGLLMNSFVHMRGATLGFEPRRAYSFTVAYPWDTPVAVLNTSVNRVLGKLSEVPGTESAGVVDRLPLHGGSQSRPIVVDGTDLSPENRERQIGWRMASEGFFPAAGIPLLSGSLFQPFREGGPRECVISQQLAAAIFGSQNPLGRRIASRPRKGHAPGWFQIAGVVGDTRLHPLDTSPALEIYVPWGADYWPVLSFVIRTDRPVGDVARMLRSDVEPLFAAQIVEKLETMEDLTADTRSALRIRAILAAMLAGVALVLSAVGLFALLAHETVRRTQEYGVRLALGAEPGSLAWDAIHRALSLTIPGVAIGVAAAFFLSRALESFLFEIRPGDPATYAGASVLMIGVSFAASLIPALRASRVNPITALRHE